LLGRTGGTLRRTLALFLLFFWSFDLDYGFIRKKLGFLLAVGATTTIYISLVSIAIASIIALLAALAKLSGNPVLYGISSFYISFFRGLPLLMQIYLIYLGLPHRIGLGFDTVNDRVERIALRGERTQRPNGGGALRPGPHLRAARILRARGDRF
jgi:His/Glu/Gln/Arg/opine family amino acid ABC transporter permease subunit